jgi:hypothetical protein
MTLHWKLLRDFIDSVGIESEVFFDLRNGRMRVLIRLLLQLGHRFFGNWRL